MSDQLEKNPSQDQIEKLTIEVPIEQLQTLLIQNKKLKSMVGASADVIGFIIDNLFGGKMPEKMDVMTISKLLLKLPKVINNMDDDKLNSLKESFQVIKTIAPEVLSENQLKQISNAG